MKFGLFYEWPNPTLRDWRVLFEEGVEQIQYSEALGFDYCLIAEHHFTNYGNSPSPLLQALHIGQRTRRLKIGTASVILPLWQPLRLAEEVAVVDNLLDGRFICGVGRGFQSHELAGFGSDLEESRGRFQETIDVLIKAWTSDDSFTYQGKHINIANPVTVFPKPLQKLHPPLLITGTSVETMQMAAKHDMLPISSSNLGVDAVRSQYGILAHAHRDLGKPVDNLRLGIQCVTHVAPTDEDAREGLKYARWQNRANRGLARQDVVNGRVSATPYDGELDDDSFFDRLFFGSPETLIKKFQRFAQAGATHVSLWMMFGGMEHEKLMRSIRLMGEEVIPALRDVRPPPGLAQDLLSQPLATNQELEAARLGRSPRT
jgi:alkanesulfonate monooxygenase SsuD/methylene tetrahydromethanopterin reductase-like flavin-dependent oxidoreductase (luciferase family)